LYSALRVSDVVRRVLDKHYKPKPNNNGPSWLSFIANVKDSLWSIDFFKVESVFVKRYKVMVVMNQYTRRIIGFAVHQLLQKKRANPSL
jgi:putative transposase